MTPARVLLARSITGQPIVLATDSAVVRCDCEQISCYATDVGVCDDLPGPGLWLWEGRTLWVGDGGSWTGPHEPYTDYSGEVRPVAPEEAAALLAMAPPEEDDEKEEA